MTGVRPAPAGADKSFEAVRDTIVEALKTLMETGVTPRSEATFRMIYAGVSSWIAKRIWAGDLGSGSMKASRVEICLLALLIDPSIGR
jgi:hypothetical protein